MKLSPLLSRYLAEKKQLNIPGIGTFFSGGVYQAENQSIPTNITFEQKNITAFDEDLVNYVSQQTGKMKSLAASDLDSQTEDMLQYINTGKPYNIKGIGTLLKKQTGLYEFNAEIFNPTESREKESIKNHRPEVPKVYIDNTARPKNNKPMLIIAGLTALAVGLTAWFYFNGGKTATQETKKTSPVTSLAPNAGDTLHMATTAPAQGNINQPATYKYVLEVAAEPRAIKRFNQLQTIKWPVELEKIDSLHYKIVMRLPAAGTDTTRIKDSLRILSGKKVYIEK